MHKKEVVFFEILTHAHRPLVQWFLARGHRIFVFYFAFDVKRMKWVRDLIHSGRIERIYIHPYSAADSLAIDAAEWVFPRFARHPLISSLARIYGRAEVEPLFKKALVENIHRSFFMRMYLEHFLKNEPGTQALLVPDRVYVLESLLRRWPDCPNPNWSGV